jgi:hypothetical protein
MIYEPLVAEGYEWINCCDDADYEVFWSFDGSPRAPGWKPVKVRRVRADDRQAFNPSDFPWLGAHALIMRRKPVEALRKMLASGGEVLPLATDDGTDLSVLNVTRVLDAIDEQRSDILRFPGSGRIMRIQSIAFLEPIVRGVDIFRLPHRASPTYVSERFVKAVQDAGLRGLEFNQVDAPPSR